MQQNILLSRTVFRAQTVVKAGALGEECVKEEQSEWKMSGYEDQEGNTLVNGPGCERARHPWG